MSIYHCSAKSGSKAGGGKAAKSAGSKEDYLERNGKYKNHDACRFAESGNMPNWAAETSYWKSADAYERKNGTLFREVEVAIPRELTIEQQNDLAKKFAWRIASVDSGDLPYKLALHEGRGTNPHVHIMLSERINDGHDRTPETWFKRAANTGKDPATGGARKADLGGDRKNWLLDVRQTWEKMANEALAKAGHNIRIDHRSLKDQGIDRLAGKHVGINAAAVERKTGQKSERRAWIEQKMAEYKPVTKPAPVLRQEVQLPPPKPELSRVELAEQTRERFFKEAREIWQKKTANRYTQEAESLTKQYWKLRKEEPKEPLLFKKKEWERQHGNWVDKVNGIAAEVKDKKQVAEVVNSGKFEANQNQVWEWNQKAQERLEKEHPELAQALKEKRLTEQQEAKEKAAANKAVSAFKSLAVKREGKFLGYRDGGKKWEAIPDRLKEAVESYNKQPETIRGAVLERMRENLRLKPGEAEKLMERLDSGKDQDKGISR